ncbi:MAG: ATP-dependent helicase [Bacteroidetes bacterium]|nr:ATP-dependent helicase [Bacteroidota bacterium]
MLTEEQIAIIHSTGNIKINAVAGSGKTTTIIEYAASRPKDSRILYLAFNKSVRLEAAKKIEERGLRNVKVETAHSLAYKSIVFSNGYNVRTQSYRTFEIVDLLGLQNNGEKHTEYILANHISKFVTYFCNSDKPKVQDLNYLDIISDSAARAFVKTFYAPIEEGTRLLLAKMDRGEIDITHDFYLKKFQLSNPLLPFDYILFDEGQDASAVMLDIFLRQKATKVIVGDVHQQIYGWRHAVNSLEKTDFKTFHLSASFRFPQDIAELALSVLDWKKKLQDFDSVVITGKGRETKEVSKATIARTNLGLLLKAIEYITENRSVRRIYFEGNINSYTYADEGASLYDVLNLHNDKRDRIRDKLVASMKDLDELDEYIEKTEDVQLSMMSEIVKEYGDEIFDIMKSLKKLHIEGDDKAKAEMVFSTVHRAKGMEYDVVYLVDDFMTEERLEKIKTEQKGKDGLLNLSKLNEEINLLYVAVTRAKHKIFIPEGLAPKRLAGSRHILAGKGAARGGAKAAEKKGAKEKSYTISEKRRSIKEAYQPWTADLDQELMTMVDAGASVGDMAEHFGRTKGAVYSRIKKLGYYPE